MAENEETVARQELIEMLSKIEDWSDPWLYRIMELGSIAVQPDHTKIQLNRDLKEVGGLCLFFVEKFKPHLPKGTYKETRQEALTLLDECRDIYAYHRGQSDLLEILMSKEIGADELAGIAEHLDDLGQRRFKALADKCYKFLLGVYVKQFTRRGRPRKKPRDPKPPLDKLIFNEAFFRTRPSEPIRTGRDIKNWAKEADRMLPKIVKENLNELPGLGDTDEEKAKAHTARIRRSMRGFEKIADGPLPGEK